MNILNSKSVLRQILQVENLQHTVNGGSTPIYSTVKEDENQFVITVKAPSISADSLQVEVARNKVRIYNTMSFVNEKGRLMMLPVNFTALDVPENANQKKTKAYEEADGVFKIIIPKGRSSSLKRKNILIEHKKEEL